MSSTYRILCLSHDPATEAGEYRTPEAAEEAIAEGLSEHPNCHLMIGRYSSPLVELGCPPSRHQPTKLRCVHGSTVWVDSDWLRLLVAAYQSPDPAVQQATKTGRHLCLSQALLGRLRLELGTEQ
ncbi:hypothetical protein [Streptomyces sp. DH12]|uniref:hypothetical protein n=1 Tax=Streptomyces sp. DH12 TaxID=2857010 RepID=UPI001E4CD0C5|nr:hypothetical protein [Streptomyces sp. DH12]